jgi:hypothetical protein
VHKKFASPETFFGAVSAAEEIFLFSEDITLFINDFHVVLKGKICLKSDFITLSLLESFFIF